MYYLRPEKYFFNKKVTVNGSRKKLKSETSISASAMSHNRYLFRKNSLLDACEYIYVPLFFKSFLIS